MPQFTTHEIGLTEPIELGVPFSYEADVEVTGSGNANGYAKTALVIGSVTDPAPVPEPNYWLPIALSLGKN